MDEYIFQQMWAKHATSLKDLVTTEGDRVLILNAGTLNQDQGADFKNARIKINELEWFGNIELHIRTSDWFRHGHDTDQNYRNIILHVVWKHDVGSFTKCPVLELGRLFSDTSDLLAFQPSISGLACADLDKQSIVEHLDWIHTWAMARFERKVQLLLKKIDISKGDIEQVAWELLARCFGFKVNSDCFEDLAKALPIKILRYHAGDLISIEALMLGHAGLLPQHPKDRYTQTLSEYYQELKWKYDLLPLHYRPLFLRMRPSNFPTIRIVQLASLINTYPNIVDMILEMKEPEMLRNLFSVELNSYWFDHYIPDKSSQSIPKKIGQRLVDSVFINLILPLQLAIQIRKGNKKWSSDALCLLEKLRSDDSFIIAMFQERGIVPENAFQSQALLELYARKCIIRDCADCSFMPKVKA